MTDCPVNQVNLEGLVMHSLAGYLSWAPGIPPAFPLDVSECSNTAYSIPASKTSPSSSFSTLKYAHNFHLDTDCISPLFCAFSPSAQLQA